MEIGISLKYFIYFMLIGGPLAVLVIYYIDIRRKRRKKFEDEWLTQRTYTLLVLLVPKNNEKTPLSAEQMFASLHGIYRQGDILQEQISFEIVNNAKFTQFYVRVPSHLKDFIEGQMYAQYPSVEIYEFNDYSQDDLSGKKIVGAEILLNKAEFYPIKTFPNFEVDPLAGVTSVISKTQDDEHVWMQMIVKPVPDKWQIKGISYVTALRRGENPEGIGWLKTLFKFFFSFIVSLFNIATSRETPATPTVNEPSPAKLPGPVESAVKAIEEKITKLGFETKIRILVASDNQIRARQKLEEIAGVFKQFNTTNLNGFERGNFIMGEEALKLYRERSFTDKGYILNIEELASIFHLPTISVETPNIVWAGSKKGEPPANLPIEETENKSELTVFAQTDFRHMQHRFGIKTRDRRLHVYAIGKTGTGKSTMLENMIIDDIKQGRGVAVVDPHGDLIDHVINFIPDSRINDVIYFNPADRDYPLSFNPLESVDPDLKNIVASGVVGIFKKIFGESWGPRLEYILRNSILALLDYPGATLLGIMRVLVDKDFRKDVVSHTKDPVIRDFFINEYEKYDPKFRTEAIAPIQNKVGQFLSSSTIRNIVGQPKSAFDIRQVMDEGKILLLDLAVGKIGEDSSALLGAMMITKIQLAAMQRSDIPEEKRRDFYLYVDEFQNFATESFAVILSEARKYHLNLILTNQYISQMLETVSKAIFGNVGTIISFRVGATDSSFLVKEFEPVFEANDLVNLDNYHIYVKMAIDGVTRPAFSAVTLSPAKEKSGNREKIIAHSRGTYGEQRKQVEEDILQWRNEEKAEEIFSKSITNDKKAQDGKLTLSKPGEYRQVIDSKNQKWYFFAGGLPNGNASKHEFKTDKQREPIAVFAKPILPRLVDRKISKASFLAAEKEVQKIPTSVEKVAGDK